MLLVNFLGAKEVSIGSVMEIAWANSFRKPIALVMEKSNPHNHSMIRRVSDFIASDLNEAIEIVTAALEVGVQQDGVCFFLFTVWAAARRYQEF